MAAKKPTKKKIEYVEDIESVSDAVRWLKDQSHIGRRDAHDLVKRFPETFKFEEGLINSSRDENYGGDPLALSNYQVWTENHSDTEGESWWRADHGILVRIDEKQPEDEREELDSLERYPILDENHHSNLEMELQEENWDDYGRDDLKREIERKSLPADREWIEKLLEEKLDEAALDEIVHDIWDKQGRYPEQEGFGTSFPKILEDWDGTARGLGDLFMLSDQGFVLVVKFSAAAYRDGKLVLRKQDVPSELHALFERSPIRAPEDVAVCDSPYFTCEWVDDFKE